MLSYRHAFHAGNHADVLKHFVLYSVLDYFNQKDKPYWYIDTHSGAGLYDLHSGEAQKIGEYRHGIGRLQQQDGLPESLHAFLQHVRSCLPEQHLYCGSPWLANSMLRASDKLRLFELHPTDIQYLRNNMQAAGLGRRGLIKQEDGYQGLLALLPPATRRAVVLIDPPYEQKQDYGRTVQTLKEALKRFATGCYLVWYPCLSREESIRLPEQLYQLLPENYVRAELHVRAPQADGFGMHGSGMFVLNPPYTLAQTLKTALPELSRILQQDEGGHFVLEYAVR